MSNFFVTLPSYTTKEFETNASHNYQVRLPQRLPLEDGEWEVGLSSASFPDAKLDLSDLTERDDPRLFWISWVKTNRAKRQQLQTSYIKVSDLANHGNITDGVEFMKTVIDIIRDKITKSLALAEFITERNYVRFKWDESVGSQTVIIGNDGDTSISGDEIFFKIDRNLAWNMGWLGKDSNTLGPNLLWMAQPKQDGSIHRGNGTRVGLDKSSTNPPPFEIKGNWMDLATSGNWRMTNLNNAFWKVVGTPSRILYAYSNVGKGVVVGNQVTDLLREIAYKREGRGTVYFEPTHIQYHPVRNKDLEIISIQISETDGDFVKFGAGQTIVTLHFRKQ